MAETDDMSVTERVLLQAVRDQLTKVRADGGGGFPDAECDIELDDNVPAIVAANYVLITSNGSARGPDHESSGGVHDWLLSVKVVVIQRAKNVPRDRKRNVFMEKNGSLSQMADRVYHALDFRYDVISRANELIIEETGSEEGFIHPLVWRDTTPPQPVPGDVFAAGNDPKAGLKKTLVFTNARRVTTRSY